MAQQVGIGIVGAGVIGASWAAFFAARGCHVRLFDSQPEVHRAARAAAQRHLSSLAALDLLDAEQRENAAERIRTADSLEEAVRDVRFVQESVSEHYDVKLDVWRRIDAATEPHVVLASSTSGLLISRLQQGLKHPQRTLIAHPFNPPHLMPLVEMVAGPQTDPEVLIATQAWFGSLGKTPIVLRKELPGHAANRLQAALWREAIQLVRDGVLSVEDVDKAVTAGPGLRWALMGPHMLFELGGGDTGIAGFCEHIGAGWRAIWRDLADWTELPPDVPSQLAEGVQVESQGRSRDELKVRRDAQLAGLLKQLGRVD